MTENEIRAILIEYFRAVDARDLNALFGLFHSEIEYIRGEQHIIGMDAFKAFYNNTRPIASGAHKLDHIFIDAPESAVRGPFVGKLKDGTDVNVDFADFMRFQDGLIIWRKTYFRGREV